MAYVTRYCHIGSQRGKVPTQVRAGRPGSEWGMGGRGLAEWRCDLVRGITLSLVWKERRHYNNYCIQCHQLCLSCSILIVNCSCSVTNTNCKLNINIYSLALQLYNVAIKITYYIIFHPNFNYPWHIPLQTC